MTRKVLAALVVGLLVGLLIGTLLPVQAGARRSDDGRLATLEQRVARLELRTTHLNAKGYLPPEFVVTPLCDSGTPAVWHAFNGQDHRLGC